MQFVLASTPRYWWPVTVRVPDPANPGKLLEQTFKIEFEPQDREERLIQADAFAKLPTELERSKHEAGEFRKFCKNWDGVVDDKGNPVPFTTENFNAAIKQSWFRQAVYRALNESENGQEARLGN